MFSEYGRGLCRTVARAAVFRGIRFYLNSLQWLSLQLVPPLKTGALGWIEMDNFCKIDIFSVKKGYGGERDREEVKVSIRTS